MVLLRLPESLRGKVLDHLEVNDLAHLRLSSKALMKACPLSLLSSLWQKDGKRAMRSDALKWLASATSGTRLIQVWLEGCQFVESSTLAQAIKVRLEE